MSTCLALLCIIVKCNPKWRSPVIRAVRMSRMHPRCNASGSPGSDTSGQVSCLTHLCIVSELRTCSLRRSAAASGCRGGIFCMLKWWWWDHQSGSSPCLWNYSAGRNVTFRWESIQVMNLRVASEKVLDINSKPAKVLWDLLIVDPAMR